MKTKIVSLFASSVLFASTVLTVAPSTNAAAQATGPTIGILQTSGTGVIQTSADGVIAGLNQAGFIDGKTATITIANAQNDVPTDTTLAQKFVDTKVDLIIAIGTPAATAAAKVTQSGKGPAVVFATVTDPFGSGIATAACTHPAWLTGIQAFAPFDQSIVLLQKVVPAAKTIGYITNPAESNSVATTNAITPLLNKAGLKLDTQTIGAKADVAGAAAKLVADKVDAIFVGSDNTVESAIADVVSAATAAKIPVFSVNPTDAAVGGLASLGLDYKQIGMDAGRLAGLILNKKLDIAKAKIVNPTATQLAINTDAAKTLGLTLPADVLSSAAITYASGAVVTPATVATMAATSDDDFATAHTCSAADMAATMAATP